MRCGDTDTRPRSKPREPARPAAVDVDALHANPFAEIATLSHLAPPDPPGDREPIPLLAPVIATTFPLVPDIAPSFNFSDLKETICSED